MRNVHVTWRKGVSNGGVAPRLVPWEGGRSPGIVKPWNRGQIQPIFEMTMNLSNPLESHSFCLLLVYRDVLQRPVPCS